MNNSSKVAVLLKYLNFNLNKTHKIKYIFLMTKVKVLKKVGFKFMLKKLRFSHERMSLGSCFLRFAMPAFYALLLPKRS